ncbi:amidohydrolase family protein, partial [Streptomyces sp. NPDC051776]|uniref:amidohydrolase family protein n=1 Tax=Streptomyces sp. NPDC051776 TaxID=3155414 RepID=UPI0034499185
MIELPLLVDQHCHGVFRTELGLGTFEACLSRSASPAAPGTTFFDTQTGFAVRRWCPPLLGLEPHCPPTTYLARRRELGVLEAGRRLLRSTGIGTYLVDTGPAGDLTHPAELAAAGDAAAHEVVRLELLAEQVADTSGTADGFMANLAEAVHGAAQSAVAFTSVAGCRHGLALAPEPPGPAEVSRAAGAWLAGRRRERSAVGAPRVLARPDAAATDTLRDGGSLTDPVLLRHLLWTAVATGLPLQLHGGTGEMGMCSCRTDPAAFTAFVGATAGLGTDLVLLHEYPYHRRAARLADAFPHVYADLGPALSRSGPRARTVLAEALELAPFGKLLFSTGGLGLPELHVVGARLFDEALRTLLSEWVAGGVWSRSDAQRVAGMIAAGNARRVYGLPDPAQGSYGSDGAGRGYGSDGAGRGYGSDGAGRGYGSDGA